MSELNKTIKINKYFTLILNFKKNFSCNRKCENHIITGNNKPYSYFGIIKKKIDLKNNKLDTEAEETVALLTLGLKNVIYQINYLHNKQ